MPELREKTTVIGQYAKQPTGTTACDTKTGKTAVSILGFVPV